MAFNPRMSSVRPTPNNKRVNKKEEEDNFMTLPEKEIVGCINDIGIPFDLSDIQQPTPQKTQRVFEWFAELLLNATRPTISPAMRAAAESHCGAYSDIFSADTRDLMGFFVSFRKLLVECAVHDFTFADLYKPTRERLVKIFSHIINFIRFRESQTQTMDKHFNKAEKTKARVEALLSENEMKSNALAELQRNATSVETALRDKENKMNDLKTTMRGLKGVQERIAETLEHIHGEQKHLKTVLEQRTLETVQTRQDTAKLRPYTTQSPSQLEANLKALNESLNNDRASVEAFEKRERALQTSADSFATVTADVQSCTTLLNELGRDLASEEATMAAAARNNDALSERSNNVREVERQEKQLVKQLENVRSKTERLRERASERKTEEARKMEKLKGVQEGLRRERGESGREMERRKVRIEQTEKKMADLKENIENEIQSAHDEYLKMDSHVRLYIKEMETSLVVV